MNPTSSFGKYTGWKELRVIISCSSVYSLRRKTMPCYFQRTFVVLRMSQTRVKTFPCQDMGVSNVNEHSSRSSLTPFQDEPSRSSNVLWPVYVASNISPSKWLPARIKETLGTAEIKCRVRRLYFGSTTVTQIVSRQNNVDRELSRILYNYFSILFFYLS